MYLICDIENVTQAQGVVSEYPCTVVDRYRELDLRLDTSSCHSYGKGKSGLCYQGSIEKPKQRPVDEFLLLEVENWGYSIVLLLQLLLR